MKDERLDRWKVERKRRAKANNNPERGLVRMIRYGIYPFASEHWSMPNGGRVGMAE